MNQLDVSPTTNQTLGEVYTFLIERSIERKVVAKVTDYEVVTLTEIKDIEAETTD